MLTIFAIPKPFKGHIAVIQHNAIKSWTLLRPEPEIILFGDEEGTAEIAQELGLRHVPEVARNEFGTPLLNSAFELAEREASYSLLAYVNADIILLSDFTEAIRRVPFSRFLMIGWKWNVNLVQPLDFNNPNWEIRLRHYAQENGRLGGPDGLDYFVFPKTTLGELPPFTIGRPYWDHWMVYRTRVLHVPVIDASEIVMAIHQTHDYSHLKGGYKEYWVGSETQRQLALVGNSAAAFNLYDATHLLTAKGLKRPFGYHHLRRRIYALPVFFPYLGPEIRLVLRLLSWGRKLLRRLQRPE